MEKVRGLWSVNAVKGRPSTKNLKCRMARYIAKSSQSKALYTWSPACATVCLRIPGTFDLLLEDGTHCDV